VAAVQDAALFGKPFDLNEHRKKQVSMRFRKLKVEPEDASENGGRDVEAERDERYGETAPF
jgi:hypothetical protein